MKNGKFKREARCKAAMGVMLCVIQGDMIKANEQLKQINSLKEQIKLNEKKTSMLKEQNKLLKKQLFINAPKEAFYDAYIERKSTYSTTMLANELEMCAAKLSKRLNVLGIQYKQSGKWCLYSRYQELDLTVVVPRFIANSNGIHGSTPQTRWTEKGRKFILNLRKENKL